jgi:hypothetical protein
LFQTFLSIVVGRVWSVAEEEGGTEREREREREKERKRERERE